MPDPKDPRPYRHPGEHAEEAGIVDQQAAALDAFDEDDEPSGE